MQPDDELCLCFHVTKRKVSNWLRITKPRVASQLSGCYGAGTGCGWCRPILVQMFRQAQEAGATSDADTLTAEEYARRRAEYIRAGKGKPAPGATPLPEPPPPAGSE
jgi:NAD(P)H-nitrite reductase large subunit